ncbi:glucokinase [Sphingorhabdus arenilitoris]|uniref:Glucokinase n=1 Tax=Sphingorhabdus arenilitoris TaxID=1490041 RepID=A0ABV8RED3_9SPHN
MSDLHEGDWLLVDIDGEIVTFGLAKPAAQPAIHSQKTYNSNDFPTATDCFSRYASDIGIRLAGRPCGMSISGAVNGDTLRIQRCRWIISITGIAYLTGSRPMVMNDSVAKAWLNLGSSAGMFPKIGGMSAVDFSKPGKWTTINYHRGLGASLLTRAEGQPLLSSESECGHIGFSPQDDMELEISQALAKKDPRVTYERILFIDRDDALWSQLSRPLDGHAKDRIRAGILGSFAGDMTLAFAGWSGLYLHGDQTQILSNAELASIFNRRFESKAGFSSVVRPVPRFLANREASNLPGVAQMMAAHHSS